MKDPAFSLPAQVPAHPADRPPSARNASRLRSLAARIVLLLLGSACAAAATAAELASTVVRVIDGDTVVVLDAGRQQHRIRLSGIDAPETRQAFSQRSRQALAADVHQREVVVEWDKRDVYGRIVGKILVDGTDVNLEQVRRGLAWHFRRYAKEQPPQDRVAYARAEDEARAAQRGLWRDPQPVAPWEFRRAQSRGRAK